jgi:DNA-binding IclR family transcriptional regulator
MDMRKADGAALERRVLEALEGGMWTAPQLAREMSIPRSRLDPLLRHLEALGLAKKIPGEAR